MRYGLITLEIERSLPAVWREGRIQMVGFTGKNSRQACAAEALITRRDALHAIRRQCLDDSAIGGRFDRHADAGMRC
jgi:hypothetical protein